LPVCSILQPRHDPTRSLFDTAHNVKAVRWKRCSGARAGPPTAGRATWAAWGHRRQAQAPEEPGTAFPQERPEQATGRASWQTSGKEASRHDRPMGPIVSAGKHGEAVRGTGGAASGRLPRPAQHPQPLDAGAAQGASHRHDAAQGDADGAIVDQARRDVVATRRGPLRSHSGRIAPIQSNRTRCLCPDQRSSDKRECGPVPGNAPQPAGFRPWSSEGGHGTARSGREVDAGPFVT